MPTPPAPPLPLAAPDLPRPVLGEAALFPDLDFRSYLAHAAISPLNLAGRRAADAYLSSVSSYGNASFGVWMDQRERLRQSLADLLRMPASTVGLAPGCTRSITDVALALPWQSNYRLVSFRGEFPANVVPYQQAASAYGGVVELLPLPRANDSGADAQILDRLEKMFKDPTKRVAYLAASAVQFQSGFRMPLAEMGLLCDSYGVTFLVDGIQACGVVPLDLEELRIDAFFSGGHKWLLGLEGTGFCAILPRLACRLKPLTAGWLSSEHGADFLFKGAGLLRYDEPLLPAPRAFEGSTANALGFAALEAGVQIVSEIGPGAIFAHVQKLFDFVEPRLMERGFVSLRSPHEKLRSCILSFEPPRGVELATLFRKLDERGIRISIPDGLLRIAPHFHNTLEQMEDFVLAIGEILAEIATHH